MSTLYKILDENNSVVRIFSNKVEAEYFKNLDKYLRIETIKVIKHKKDTNRFTWAHKILGDSLV